jgi:hypothetical protein
MRSQITDGIAEEVDAPADAGERWFRHNPNRFTVASYIG